MQRIGKFAGRTDHIIVPATTPVGLRFDDTVSGMLYIEPGSSVGWGGDPHTWLARAELNVLDAAVGDDAPDMVLGMGDGVMTAYSGIITIAKVEAGSPVAVAGAVAAAARQQAVIRGRRGR